MFSLRRAWRGRGPSDDGMLVFDKNPAFRGSLAELLVRQNLPVAWVSDEAKVADSRSQLAASAA